MGYDRLTRYPGERRISVTPGVGNGSAGARPPG